jgi:transposase
VARKKRESSRKVEVVESQLEEIYAYLRKLEEKLAQAEHENDLLRRALAGRRSERVDPNTPYFPQLAISEDLDMPASEEDEGPTDDGDGSDDGDDPGGKPRRGGSSKGRLRGVGRLPNDLPRIRREHHPKDHERMCACCGAEKVRIGESVRSRLEYVPASLVVVDDVKVKVACRQCQGEVSTAMAPVTPIERGLPGPALLAFVINSKYGEHSTLYRLESFFERHNVRLNRSTMCGWVAAACGLLEPIVQEIRRRAVESFCVQLDETSLRVLGGPGVGGSHRGRLWVYGGLPGEVFYDYAEYLSRDDPESMLAGRTGYVQADAWPGFNKMFRGSDLVELGCWAHARRKYFDALGTSSREATEMLGMIRLLYKIERKAQRLGLDPDARRELRLREAVPVLRMIKNWIKEARKTVFPKSPLGAAIRYTVNQWRALRRYVKDGRLEIDNNRAERAFRGVALGRRNWLFVGSKNVTRHASVILSLIQSCRELSIDPFLYLRDVLELVGTTPASQVATLTPRGWLERQPDKKRHVALSQHVAELDTRVWSAFAAATA